MSVCLSSRSIIITYADGRLVSLVCSSKKIHTQTHTHMHQSDSNTKLVVMYQDGGLHISPTMDDLVRLHSGHLVNDQTENNKCSSASHSDGVHQPFLSCRLFNEGQTDRQ